MVWSNIEPGARVRNLGDVAIRGGSNRNDARPISAAERAVLQMG
jgi:hypothetical protein